MDTKQMKQMVRAWRETVIIPTYEIGKPEKNPIFLEKRVYQGSSGSVYPYAVVETIGDEKQDKAWNAIYLENAYVKIMILPELGGRIQMAFDKTKQRHFVYYNHVIKPALVGLTGPWISGGIEFNWPQHHRPSTYEPVDACIEAFPDGSVTVWCSEIERMSRTKGMAGFTLYPDKAYLEIQVKIYNRTPHPQTFLWWANPAVKVNDYYQSVFPPDVHAVFDHGKRAVSGFPIATGEYYKVDYSAGVDISKYKNIPVPTSYMAIKSEYDFVGGYENDAQAGLLHVADHQQSPGKKQWTWGNGDFGQAWDRNLTDEDGPYIELMCGVYTDNQPDFSWLQPYEEKSFRQYFMPYRDLGLVKNANKEAMINMEQESDGIRIKAYTTGVYNQVQVRLKRAEHVLYEQCVDFSPEMSWDALVQTDEKLEGCQLSLTTKEGAVLVSWEAKPTESKPIPEPAVAAKDPEDIDSMEQLYLQGLHLEQYRHATYDPAAYYLEALRREPENARCNNAMGLWLMRKGSLQEAESYFTKAINTLTQRNPNPYDGEPMYHLAVCLFYQSRWDEAYDAFCKAAWNAAWQDSGFFHAALIDCRFGRYEKALELVDRSLSRNSKHQKARHLKVSLLRHLHRNDEAMMFAEDTMKLDRLNLSVLYEQFLISEDKQYLRALKQLARGYVHSYIEYALDFAAAGLYQDAIDLMDVYLQANPQAYPMAWYFKGWFLALANKPKEAERAVRMAEHMSFDGCFPNRIEELLALQSAVEFAPEDAYAWACMGNYWYANRRYERAVSCWETSREMNEMYPTVHRNLALAYFNKLNKPQEARASLEEAFRLDPTDARVLMELDQLYKKLLVAPQERLKALSEKEALILVRDDLYLERVALNNLLGKEAEALTYLLNRHFHPWEGGEGKVVGQYVFSRIELAKKALNQKDPKTALLHLKACEQYPLNLGEGKLAGAQENDVYYWKGCVYQFMGESERARAAWIKATSGNRTPVIPMYYNDPQPDQIFYQGLALSKIGHETEAVLRFKSLLEFGQKHLSIPFKMDYFAVSLPDLFIFEEDLQVRHRIHCLYLMGLGHLGLKHFTEATHCFSQITSLDPYHMGVTIHAKLADQWSNNIDTN